MPLQATSGAASYDAFGGGVPVVIPYIEDVFSTYLYTGTGASQTITNNINTTTYGGLTWIKGRSGATGNRLTDTTRGVTKSLESNSTAAETTETTGLTAFGTTGFTIGADADYNTSAATYCSWTFREQPKFFDIVTYTGTGANRTIAHNLGSVPGFIIVKRTDTTADWQCYHRSLANTQYLVLNSTAAVATGATRWNSTTPTSSVFSVGTDATVNASGGTYVAYVYAHNAGGFGLTGTDNVISCGGGACVDGYLTASLGFEPQWVLVKGATVVQDWYINDSMRGMTASTTGSVPLSNTSANLRPNLSNAEVTSSSGVIPNATGFTFTNGSNAETYIYIAIRRGPMKVPTVGTSVFNALDLTGTGSTVVRTGAGFTPDLIINRAHANDQTWWADRLRGVKAYLGASNTNAETGSSSGPTQDLISFDMNGVTFGTPNYAGFNNSGSLEINWLMKRAPSFFDEVCYTGDGTSNPARSINHSLGVKPEFAILKSRSDSGNWLSVVNIGSSYVYSSAGSDFGLNLTSFPAANLFIGTTYVSATAFQLGFLVPDIDVSATQRDKVNANSATYVAYLFATCPGVSKVGTYTGNGTTQTINCGFTGGARFVLIKRTGATGDWYVYDTIRGMTTLTDPYMLLNTTGAEVATLGSVTTVSTGFALNSAILAAINVSAATYIFLAIA
jgi:hypothetical protein